MQWEADSRRTSMQVTHRRHGPRDCAYTCTSSAAGSSDYHEPGLSPYWLLSHLRVARSPGHVSNGRPCNPQDNEACWPEPRGPRRCSGILEWDPAQLASYRHAKTLHVIPPEVRPPFRAACLPWVGACPKARLILTIAQDSGSPPDRPSLQEVVADRRTGRTP